MRNLKRLLTMVLAIAMMMSLMVVGAGAAFKDQDKIENTEAVNMNVALGIINGRDDGSFDPTGNVTRAEMAKMICVLLNGGTEPSLPTKDVPVFTDIKGHWGEKYVEYCASLGIIAGMGDGTFAPDKTVTATQAAKMLLVALGYDAAFEGFNGASWSVKIGVAANQKDLYDELGAIDPNAALNRDDAAQMIWNALQANEVKYDYSLTTVNGQLMNVQKREDKADTLMTDKFKTIDTDFTTAIMTGISYNSTSKKYTYTFSNTDYAKYASFTTKADFTNLFGHNVTTVAKTTSDVYGMYANDSTVIFSGLIDDIDFADATKSTSPSVEFNDKDYDLSKVVKDDGNNVVAPLTVKFNDFSSKEAVLATKPTESQVYYKAEAIDNTDDGKIDLIVYYPVTWGQVTYAGKDYIRVDNGVGQLDFDDYQIYQGVAKDDYVMVDKNGLVDDVVTKLDEVKGKLTNIAGSTVTIDGKKYDQSALADDKKLKSGNINDTFKFVAINGYLVKQSASDVVNLNEMLLVASIADGKNANGGKDAKVYFTDGTSKVVSITSDATHVALGEVAQNTTYKYEVSKGEYKLTKLTNTDKFGFDFAKQNEATTAWVEKNNGGSDYATIDGYRIADNAIVLSQDGATSTYNLITGAKLSKITSSDMDIYAYGVEENDTTGYYYVTFAVVTGSTSATSDRSYGFIMSNVDQSVNADKEDVYTFDMWNGTEKVTAVTTGDPALHGITPVKGAVISYGMNGDKIDDIFVLSGTDTGATNNAKFGAVLATDGKYVDVLLDAKGTVQKYKIDTEDTTLMYVSVEDKTGDKTGNIVKADKADAPTAFRNNAGEYYTANVLVLADGSSATLTADLIAMDVDNDILAKNAKVNVTSGAYTLSTDVAADETLVVNGNLTVSTPVTLEGTVVVNGNFAPTAAVTVEGTLIVTGNVTIANTMTIAAGGVLSYEGTTSIAATGTLSIADSVAVAELRAFVPAAGATLTLGSTSSDNYTSAAPKFYTTKGSASSDGVAEDGVQAQEVSTTTTKIPAGTYTYGTLGFAGGANDTATLAGWFK